MHRIGNKQTRNKQTLLIVVSGAFALLACLSGCNKLQSAQSLVNDAKQYHQKGNNKAAIIQLKNALQKKPDNAEARYLLGTIFLESGDPQSAENEIRKAITSGMGTASVLPNLAKSLLMQGQYQKVLDETMHDPRAKDDPELATLRGSAYAGLRDNLDAKESFERALKSKPDFSAALIGLSKLAVMDKDFDTALRLSEQAAAKNPDDVDALLFKGDLLRLAGKGEQALAAYDQTLKVKPDNTSARLAKAYLEIGMRKFAEAKIDLDAAKKIAPNGLLVTQTQGMLDFTQGKYAVALEAAQKVLRVAPDHMPSLLLAGIAELALGSTEQAEQHLKKYLERDPRNLYARKMLASALLKNGQVQRAINIVETALTETQQDPQLYMLAGEAYLQTKDFAKSTEYFEKANTLAPQVAAIHTALAMSKLGQGDSDRAVNELEKATGLDSKSPREGILLVMTHIRLKEFDKAIAAANAFDKAQPGNPMIQSLKGVAYLNKKDVPNARANFEKAIALEPTFFPAVANLAQLDLQDGKPDAAKKRFLTLLEKDKKNIQAMTSLASLALLNKQNDESKDWLERANNENPDAVLPAKLLVGHYLRMGEKQKSLALAQKLQNTHPSNPEFIELLAQTQMANNDKIGALESYNKLAILIPDSAPIQVRIAKTAMVLQKDDIAAAALKKALSIDPANFDAQLASAQFELKKSNFEGALAIARQVQKQKPKLPIGYVMEGDVLMIEKKPALAIKSFEQAAAISPSGPLIVKMHDALNQAGKAKDADARTMQWLKDHPGDTVVRMYLAERNLENKQLKAAIEQFQLILKTEPNNATALNNIAWAYDQEKDSRAMEFAEQAYAQAPENAGVLDTLGWILVEQGNTKRGLPMLEKAITLAPAASEIRYHLALGLIKTGDKTKARKELEQLIATGKSFPKIDEAKTLLKQL